MMPELAQEMRTSVVLENERSIDEDFPPPPPPYAPCNTPTSPLPEPVDHVNQSEDGSQQSLDEAGEYEERITLE